MSPADKWVDRNAGPVVRPYALTGGRTEQADGAVLDLVAVVVAMPAGAAGEENLTPEESTIVGLCQQPVTVTDVAAATSLPLGVVRVLLADLIQRGRITLQAPPLVGDQPATELLKEVLNGLRAL
jgi:hypothetical protein